MVLPLLAGMGVNILGGALSGSASGKGADQTQAALANAARLNEQRAAEGRTSSDFTSGQFGEFSGRRNDALDSLIGGLGGADARAANQQQAAGFFGDTAGRLEELLGRAPARSGLAQQTRSAADARMSEQGSALRGLQAQRLGKAMGAQDQAGAFSDFGDEMSTLQRLATNALGDEQTRQQVLDNQFGTQMGDVENKMFEAGFAGRGQNALGQLLSGLAPGVTAGLAGMGGAPTGQVDPSLPGANLFNNPGFQPIQPLGTGTVLR